MSEEKYTIVEEYELPSKGLIYDKQVNPHIRLKSMTVRDEMKRTAQQSSNHYYRVLSDIIEGCMLDKPSVSVYDMCLGDFDYILHKLRIVSQGNIYKMIGICPECGNIEETSVDLDKEKVLDWDFDKFKELLTIKLPVSGKEVTLTYQTPRMLDNIKVESESMRKDSNEDLDFERFVKLKESISLVDGNKLSYTQKDSFLKNLSVKDQTKLENRIDKINTQIGLDSLVSFTCSKCKKEVKTFFRFGPEFFRPSDDE